MNSKWSTFPTGYWQTIHFPPNWMSRSALKINEDNTEFIIFSGKHYTYDQMSIQIGTNTIQHNNNVKIHEVTLDAHMTLESRRATYVGQAICRSVDPLPHCRYSKNTDTGHRPVRLDYCNSINTNLLPMKSIHRLQITQNSAARLISRTPRHEHITPVLV